MGNVSAVAVAWLLALSATQARDERSTQQLEEVVVEERAEGDFADFEDWDREVRDGLSRAKLKERHELTEHDHAQILILQNEMPLLKRSLDKIQFLVRAHKFRQTLTHREIEELSKAYRTAEAILENVPDAFMPRCRQLRKYDSRNKMATCDVDYLAIERQIAEYTRARGKDPTQQTGHRIASHGAAAPVAPDRGAAFIKVASRPPRIGAERVHVQADYFRPLQPRVAFSGDAMLRREDFLAMATALPELVPAHAVRLELPTGTGLSLSSHDRLDVLGYVSMGEEILRVVSLPRAATAGYGIVVRADGTIEGTLVAFEYGWSDRRRLAPVNGLRATVLPADARLITQYDVEQVLPERPFVRYDIVFVGAPRDKLVLELRRYDAPAPADAATSERHEFAAAPGRIALGGLQIEVRELEPKRIKYVVHEVAPAADALVAGAR